MQWLRESAQGPARLADFSSQKPPNEEELQGSPTGGYAPLVMTSVLIP